ncbi:MAG: efflux RND transporter periplasmic adaptor subunit [Alphaproteobacteria bacterium]|nr:efflux RND transporter periplasmic adaptor subunit [Alphaproteobacteria bacterium]
MRVWSQIAATAVLAAVGAAGWFYRDEVGSLLADGGERPAAAARGPGGFAVPVEVAVASSGEVVSTVSALGTARANEAVSITAEVTAVVRRIAFVDGGRVAKGDVLFELDAGEINAEIQETRAERDNARQLLDRAQRLFESGNTPQSRLDELTAQVRVSEARVQARELMLEDYVVRAPFDGTVGLRQVSVGALVTPGLEITTLDDTTRMKADFRVPETALAALRPGLHLEARSAAFPGRVFEGTVATIDTRVDPDTRSIVVRTIIPNSDGLIRPGMFLTAALTVARRTDAILIPEQAVVTSGEGHFVFAVIDGAAVRTDVTLGEHTAAGMVEVVEGLAPGIPVIIAGVQKVSDGAPVQVIGAQPGADEPKTGA